MKITTRTPPVKIAASDLIALTSLPPEYSGLLLKWGMSLYADGTAVPVEIAKAESGYDEKSWVNFIHVVRPQLNHEALADGKIKVTAFEKAADHQAKISATKARAASAARAVKVIKIAAQIAQGQGKSIIDKTLPKNGAEFASVDNWDRIAKSFLDRAVPHAEVHSAIARWKQDHSIEDVISAMTTLGTKNITKPVRYVETVLSNMRASRNIAIPDYRYAHEHPVIRPRPVKRKIKVEPRHTWRLEGWTAKGHIEGGPNVADRKQVWRNDSGTLTYTAPQVSSVAEIPTYEQDPGIYEID